MLAFLSFNLACILLFVHVCEMNDGMGFWCLLKCLCELAR